MLWRWYLVPNVPKEALGSLHNRVWVNSSPDKIVFMCEKMKITWGENNHDIVIQESIFYRRAYKLFMLIWVIVCCFVIILGHSYTIYCYTDNKRHAWEQALAIIIRYQAFFIHWPFPMEIWWYILSFSALLTIDNGGHGQDHSLAVSNQWVHWLVLDNREVLLQMTLILKIIPKIIFQGGLSNQK